MIANPKIIANVTTVLLMNSLVTGSAIAARAAGTSADKCAAKSMAKTTAAHAMTSVVRMPTIPMRLPDIRLTISLMLVFTAQPPGLEGYVSVTKSAYSKGNRSLPSPLVGEGAGVRGLV